MSAKNLQWKVWIDCEETIADTFLIACERIMQYVRQHNDKSNSCFDRVWIAYGDEIISLNIISQVVLENK